MAPGELGCRYDSASVGMSAGSSKRRPPSARIAATPLDKLPVEFVEEADRLLASSREELARRLQELPWERALECQGTEAKDILISLHGSPGGSSKAVETRYLRQLLAQISWEADLIASKERAANLVWDSKEPENLRSRRIDEIRDRTRRQNEEVDFKRRAAKKEQLRQEAERFEAAEKSQQLHDQHVERTRSASQGVQQLMSSAAAIRLQVLEHNRRKLASEDADRQRARSEKTNRGQEEAEQRRQHTMKSRSAGRPEFRAARELAQRQAARLQRIKEVESVALRKRIVESTTCIGYSTGSIGLISHSSRPSSAASASRGNRPTTPTFRANRPTSAASLCPSLPTGGRPQVRRPGSARGVAARPDACCASTSPCEKSSSSRDVCRLASSPSRYSSGCIPSPRRLSLDKVASHCEAALSEPEAEGALDIPQPEAAVQKTCRSAPAPSPHEVPAPLLGLAVSAKPASAAWYRAPTAARVPSSVSAVPEAWQPLQKWLAVNAVIERDRATDPKNRLQSEPLIGQCGGEEHPLEAGGDQCTGCSMTVVDSQFPARHIDSPIVPGTASNLQVVIDPVASGDDQPSEERAEDSKTPALILALRQGYQGEASASDTIASVVEQRLSPQESLSPALQPPRTAGVAADLTACLLAKFTLDTPPPPALPFCLALCASPLADKNDNTYNGGAPPQGSCFEGTASSFKDLLTWASELPEGTSEAAAVADSSPSYSMMPVHAPEDTLLSSCRRPFLGQRAAKDVVHRKSEAATRHRTSPDASSCAKVSDNSGIVALVQAG